ncbi:MAG: AraC family transcriptional regulator [Chloroflexales bacterium]|nr:AraC family transcriptional regulator [Chloroflexales bacterium]
MPQHEWTILRHDLDVGVDALHALFTTHAFARHWHDYYVIGLVEDGAQTFRCRQSTYLTPRGGLILLNPGDAHTGEVATSATAFGYRAFYPTTAHVAPLMAELGRPDELPSFPSVRIDDPALAASVRQLHAELGADSPAIDRETRWLTVLAALITRYGAGRLALPAAGREPRAVALAQAYIETHASEAVTLAHLAAQVGLSPFHLVRVFHRAMGVPPHAYLESVRISRAQRLIAAGTPLAEVSYAVGYSSQSHFTTRFRRIIGVTPGHYRAAL